MIHRTRFHRHNPEDSGLGGLIKNAVPIATSFGVSRVGSGIISKVVSKFSQQPLVVKTTPIISSALFVGLAYLVTKLRAFRKYRTPAIIGSVSNVVLTIVAQLIPASKPLMGLKGWDYSHAQPFARHIPGPDMDLGEDHPSTKREETKQILALESGEKDSEEDLNTGVFAGGYQF